MAPTPRVQVFSPPAVVTAAGSVPTLTCATCNTHQPHAHPTQCQDVVLPDLSLMRPEDSPDGAVLLEGHFTLLGYSDLPGPGRGAGCLPAVRVWETGVWREVNPETGLLELQPPGDQRHWLTVEGTPGLTRTVQVEWGRPVIRTLDYATMRAATDPFLSGPADSLPAAEGPIPIVLTRDCPESAAQCAARRDYWRQYQQAVFDQGRAQRRQPPPSQP